MRPGRSTDPPRRRLPRTVTLGVTVAAAATLGFLLMAPTGHGAVRLAVRLAGVVRTAAPHARRAPVTLRRGHLPVRRTPAVGALFTVSRGRLGRHFCTASVVDSPVKDLVITAAHCVSGMQPGRIAFVPGYDHGLAPYGVWFATQVIVSGAWRAGKDPNDDVAFLVVAQRGSHGRLVQDVTGGDRLGIGWPAREQVRVVGYPDNRDRPLACRARTRAFGPSQMRFDCGGYTDGTSGGPFLAHVNRTTGEDVVIGVIGGYEQGGNLPSVSYSARFGSTVRALYQTAVAQG